MLNVRPHAKVSGPRHVPVLASANGIPFLRFGKPQPPALSRILRQRLDRRNERFDSKIILSNYWAPIAQHEDEWDAIVQGKGNMKDTTNAKVQWIDAVDHACRLDSKAYEMALARDRAHTEKMIQIVDAETKLAKEEGQVIRRGRKTRPIRSRWLV